MNLPEIMSGGRWTLFFWALLTGVCVAHPILQNPMWVEVAPEVLNVKLYVSLRELNVVQGLPITADGEVETALAIETAPRHSAYVLDHLVFRADGVPLSGKVIGIDPPQSVGKGTEGPDRAHFVYRLEYSLARPPAQISLSHTMVREFPSAPGVPWDLSYTYRFGPPGATPVEFGSITRDVLVTYKTGFAQPPGTVAVGFNPARTWPLLSYLLLLGAALGLGVGQRSARKPLVLVTTIAFLIGCGTAVALDWRIPAFLVAALNGIGVVLVSVDNIHRPLAPFDDKRWVMAVIFPALAGISTWSLAAVSDPPDYGILGWLLGCCPTQMIFGLSLGSALARNSADRPVPEGQHAKHPRIQLASLLISAGGLVILLEGLGIRPWSYWLNRLTS